MHPAGTGDICDPVDPVGTVITRLYGYIDRYAGNIKGDIKMKNNNTVNNAGTLKKTLTRIIVLTLVMSLLTGCGALKQSKTGNTGNEITDAPLENTKTPEESGEPQTTPEGGKDVITETPAKEEVTPEQEKPTEEAEPDDVVPEPDIRFLTTDFDGNGWDETCFFDAKVTMINLWAYWCGPCVGEIPEIDKLSHDYADRQVQILGITYPEEEFDNREAAKELKISYPILFYTEDFDRYMDSGYLPTTIFVDSEGHVLGEPVIGARDYAEWAEMLDGFLAE